MPVEVFWYDDEQTIIVQRYTGSIKTDDYYTAVDQVKALAATVPHTVYNIFDRTGVVGMPRSVLGAMRYANRNMPDNLDLRVIVAPTYGSQILMDLGQHVAPEMVRHLEYADTFDEALQMIRKRQGIAAQGGQ